MITCLVLITIAVAISIFNFFSNPKIAYVRNQELVYGYEGMKDANKKYEEETKGWTMTIDSLEKNFHLQVSKYNSTFAELNEKERKEFEERLQNQKNQVINLKEAVSKNMEQKDLEITQRVLDQINSFVQEYAQAKGYNLIIGTTSDGNLMFADESLDITKDVLTELNYKYYN
jgi:outer membrane protein